MLGALAAASPLLVLLCVSNDAVMLFRGLLGEWTTPEGWRAARGVAASPSPDTSVSHGGRSADTARRRMLPLLSTAMLKKREEANKNIQ